MSLFLLSVKGVINRWNRRYWLPVFTPVIEQLEWTGLTPESVTKRDNNDDDGGPDLLSLITVTSEKQAKLDKETDSEMI